MARLLGIDFGEKRIGVALSDEGVRLAFPHTTIINNKDSINEVLKLVEDYEVEKVVIGESKDFNMRENRIMQEAKDFADELKAKNVEVFFHAEFMTSMQAEKTHFQLSERHKDRGVQKTKQIDAQAAAIMLQSYIDTNK
ncbi:MAG: Holliday junction resolvase RuvX [Candidatus Paceibacterota bacterium]